MLHWIISIITCSRAPLLATGAKPGEARPPTGTGVGRHAPWLRGHLHTRQESDIIMVNGSNNIDDDDDYLLPDVAGVSVRHPCQGRGRGELGGGEGDGRHGEGHDDPRGGAHPQHVLDSEERGDPETRCLVLPDDLVTVGQHLGHGRGAGHLDSGYVDI